MSLPPVHVVGNGEMTVMQEHVILSPSRVGQVWGFNDLKGMPDGLMPDVLVQRWHHGEYPEPPEGIPGRPRRVLRLEGPCSPDPACCIHVQNLTLFPDCNYSDAEGLQEVRDNPSSGMIALGLLEDDDNVSRVNVYAMNFQFQFGLAHSHHEKEVATQCCTKCRFHPTYSPFYFPIRHIDSRWMLQFMGMYLIPLVVGGTSLLLMLAGLGLCCYARGRRRCRGVEKAHPCDTDLQDKPDVPLFDQKRLSFEI
jgi:hypothetical protein